MHSFISFIKKILPTYGVLPLITVVMFNAVTYFGTRLFTEELHHYNMTLPIDEMIPLWLPAISIYVFSYVFWAVGFVVIARESREVCYRFLTAEMLAKFSCLICFVFLPTTMLRPEAPMGNDIWSFLTRIIYESDAATNLFPSIHCLESWVCFRGAMHCKKVPKWFVYVSLCLALAVFASTLLVRQHVILDIPAAIIAVELGIYLSGKWRTGRFFAALNRKARIDRG